MLLKEDITTFVTSDPADLLAWASDGSALLVADVETYGTEPKDGKLLGIALASVYSPEKPIYVALQWYDNATSSWHRAEQFDGLLEALREVLKPVELIGHNYSYDKRWVDHSLGINSTWRACTRLMWHMASAPATTRPYGLKDAQVEVLGWAKKGDVELNEQIKSRRGKPGPDMYLADVATLGKYACYDASSTALLFLKLKGFFDQHEYWWLLEEMVEYSWALQACTDAGVRVDEDALVAYVECLKDTKAAYANEFMELAKPYIDRLERQWRDDTAAKYKSEASRTRFLSDWSKQKKFNLSSDVNKKELFYDVLKLPTILLTKGKKPSTAMDALRVGVRKSERQDLNEIMEAYECYEEAESILTGYAKPWLAVVSGGRLHPRFNPCGTVSYRLAGYKPSFLNPPFDDYGLMSCFTCDEGWEGVHADFKSAEPAVTAHYSQDPSLLKVFRDNKGDVYLDLVLTLFPEDEDAKRLYDPEVAPTEAVKKALKVTRGIAKVLHLAAQYTGKKFTIQRNLMIAGFDRQLEYCADLVVAYWKHFKKVDKMNEALHRSYDRNDMIRNVVGRIIRFPHRRDKDLPNRFIQSSAHDLLSFWALRIYRQVKLEGLRAKPVILDCHDSTSWQAHSADVGRLEEIFVETLQELNEQVKMTVPIAAEIKRFKTLAGLKGDDV